MKRTFKNNGALKTGLGLLSLVVISSAIGALLDPYPAQDLSRALARPSAAHWFGCDPYGVDLGYRVLVGAWQSLRVSVVVTVLTMVLGLVVGTAAALAPTWVRAVIGRLIDCVMAFPGLLLAILIAAVMPHSERTVIFALTVTRWTVPARFCQALIERASTAPFIVAARAAGASPSRVITRHLWPSMIGQLYVQASLFMGYVIMAEAGLSFLGLGGSAGNSSWGKLIAEGREYLVEAPHLSLIPGVAFLATVLAFTLIAEGLRNKLDRRADAGV